MNQILSVEKNNKKSKKTSIHTILIVFSIILIIFGICLASTGAYSYLKNASENQDNNALEISTNTKPVISIEREDATNIKITVVHDKELESVTYSINSEEPKKIETNNKTEVNQSINLPAGSSNIKIIAEDINGISSSREDSFQVAKEVITLEKADGRIRVKVDEDADISYVLYYWDENVEEAIKRNIDSNNQDVLIDVLEGSHKLNVVAVNSEGQETKKSQEIKGDKKPSLSIKTNGKVFKINASDDEGLSRIEIKLNSNEIKKEEIEGKDYTTSIDLEDGVNKLIVTVYNENDVSATSKVKYTKE